MTSKDNGEAQDKELLERYRRASDTEASVPSEAVRAAILAEGRRVAGQLAKQGSRPAFDTARPAANDSRWKIPAFGTLGAALLAALLIAPRYWPTQPASTASTPRTATNAITANNVAAAPPTAADSAPAAPAVSPPPKLESAAPASRSESLKEVVVTQANRKRSDAPAEVAAKTSAASEKDLRLANAPAPAQAPPTATGRAVDSAIYNSADRLAGARTAPMPARLQSAAKAGDLEQATLLLDQGAAVDERDAQGRTPLMLAIAQGRLEVVRLLLQRGADPNQEDNSGKTPLQQATDRKLNDIAGLLRDAGAH